jgi:hypothetical protein
MPRQGSSGGKPWGPLQMICTGWGLGSGKYVKRTRRDELFQVLADSGGSGLQYPGATEQSGISLSEAPGRRSSPLSEKANNPTAARKAPAKNAAGKPVTRKPAAKTATKIFPAKTGREDVEVGGVIAGKSSAIQPLGFGKHAKRGARRLPVLLNICVGLEV